MQLLKMYVIGYWEYLVWYVTVDSLLFVRRSLLSYMLRFVKILYLVIILSLLFVHTADNATPYIHQGLWNRKKTFVLATVCIHWVGEELDNVKKSFLFVRK